METGRLLWVVRTLLARGGRGRLDPAPGRDADAQVVHGFGISGLR